MKVTRDKTEDCQAFLTIEMEAAEVAESLEAAYHRLAKRTNIPGFRKGKAPRSVLERHIRKDNLLEDAVNHLVPEAYEKAIKEQDIKAIAQPRIEVTQTEPVIFNAIVAPGNSGFVSRRGSERICAFGESVTNKRFSPLSAIAIELFHPPLAFGGTP